MRNASSPGAGICPTHTHPGNLGRGHHTKAGREQRSERKNWRHCVKQRHVLKAGSLLNFRKVAPHRGKGPPHKDSGVCVYMGLGLGRETKGTKTPLRMRV